MAFQNVAFLLYQASFSATFLKYCGRGESLRPTTYLKYCGRGESLRPTTFLKYCGRGESLRPTTYLRTVVGCKLGHAPCKILLLNKILCVI